MRLSLVLAATTASMATALNTAFVTNKCTFPIYVWSVGSSVSNQSTLETGQSYSETTHRDATTGGIALKVTTEENGLYVSGVAQTILSYTLDSTQLWYDLSDVYGDAFKGKKVAVTVSNSACSGITWATGVPPAGSQTRSCDPTANIRLTLCA
ncbi:hypothetical protein EDC01DRAFT_780924 [Geopyxis carbonaria]|nr:hypothetical protein EDC01DRAFT_780924 [Geopyxis carbonaria]